MVGLMLELQAPSVRTRSKTRFHPSRVDEAIAAAAMAIRGTADLVAVYCDEEVVGAVAGDVDRDVVRFVPWSAKQWAGWDGYEAMEIAMQVGKVITPVFSKLTNSWTRANVWGDYWTVSGLPGAGDYSGTANTARQCDEDTAGAIDIRGKTPANGETRHFAGSYIANLANPGSSTCCQLFWLYDRTLVYDGCSITTTTTNLTNTLAAQRHISAGQSGLQIMVTASAALGATVSNLSSVVITDNGGNTGVALAPGYTMPWFTSGPAGSTTSMAPVIVPHDNGNGQSIAPWLPMPAGIRGARKIESFASSAINTGTATFALIKPTACIWSSGALMAQLVDNARMGFQLPRIYDSACLNLMSIGYLANGSLSSSWLGMLKMAHGS